jgi:uncharacterized membrane protein (UPF0127 family)
VRTGKPIATTVEAAFDGASRKRGLLGRSGLQPGHALAIAPTNLVHTFFMQFAIDIIFARRDGTVVKIRRSVPARRIAGALRGFAVIEMAAGSLGEPDLRVGDRLALAQD